jgi:hypothetical protein
MTSPFFANHRVRPTAGILSRVVGTTIVLLDSTSGRCFALDDVGTRAWQALTASVSIQDAYDELLTEYQVDAEPTRAGWISRRLTRGEPVRSQSPSRV